MAIDTRDERASVLGIGIPWWGPLPDADSDVDAPDRAQLLGCFAGFSYAVSGVTGTSAGVVNEITGSAAGTVGVVGAATGSVNAITGSAAGTVGVVGAATGSINAIVGAAAGAVGVVGTSAGLVNAITGTGAGVTGRSAALSGTAVAAPEAAIVAGGRTILLTLSGDTWVAGPAFDLIRTPIIGGLDSDGSEPNGWNAEVRDKEVATAVVRTSATVVTITLSPAAAYDITAPETVTATIPAVALVTSTSDIVASPAFTLHPDSARRGGGRGAKNRRVMVDGQIYRVTSRDEERAILDQYLAQQRQQLETAEPAHEPTISAKIRRAERRRERVIVAESEEAERTRELQAEDDEILLLLLH